MGNLYAATPGQSPGVACVYIYICHYIYICVTIYIYTCVIIYIYVSLYIYIALYINVITYISKSQYLYIYMSLYIYIYLFIIHVYIYLSTWKPCNFWCHIHLWPPLFGETSHLSAASRPVHMVSQYLVWLCGLDGALQQSSLSYISQVHLKRISMILKVMICFR